MSRRPPRRLRPAAWPLATLGVVLLPTSAGALELYVDPDFAGTATGAAAAPWPRLDASMTAAWTTIDVALATADVIVYFSAREAGTDVDEVTTTRIAIRRTDPSSHRLTLDGMSKYNTNDAAPSWAAYSGPSRFKITTASYSIESGFGPPKRNYVTVRGFKAEAGSSKAFYYWGGDHLVVEDNAFAGTSVSTGCLVQLEYAHRVDPLDPRQNGGCTDIVFRNNAISDATGEGLYIGGAENTGLSAHSDIRIEDNVIANTGRWGGEGDCIDIKDGSAGVSVRGNLCFNTVGTGHYGIVTHSAAAITRNVIYGMSGSGIELNTYWGRGWSDAAVTGNLVFANDVDGIAVRSSGSDRLVANVLIDHNSVIGSGRCGLYLNAGTGGAIATLTATNNLFVDGGQTGVCVSGPATPTTFAWNDVFGNAVSAYSGIANATGTNGNVTLSPSFVDPATPAGADNGWWTADDGWRSSPGAAVLQLSATGGPLGAYGWVAPGPLPPGNLRAW